MNHTFTILCLVISSDSDGYEFVIVSLENKQWHFEAQNGEVNKTFASYTSSDVFAKVFVVLD